MPTPRRRPPAADPATERELRSLADDADAVTRADAYLDKTREARDRRIARLYVEHGINPTALGVIAGGLSRRRVGFILSVPTADYPAGAIRERDNRRRASAPAEDAAHSEPARESDPDTDPGSDT